MRDMTAYEYLKSLPYLPHGKIHAIPGNKLGRPSNSEIYRWLKTSSVVINGKTMQPHDKVELPIKELIFFPKGKRVTMI